MAAAGVARVLVACADPSPKASGRGGERLQAAGVTVQGGVLAEEAAPLYADYVQRLASGGSSS
jgi:diaminohydroxyphosphoribosylaminopyrimidine deaminase/5-amino-6-(5-phosphoribosylamino)uracil reductase